MRSEQEVTGAIEQYSDLVLRLCTVHLKNSADADDIFQTVFLKYALSNKKFESPEHEKAWLIRVTTNACKDLLKSFSRKNTISMDEITVYAPAITPEQYSVMEAVWSLPRNYREVVYLHYFEGYTAPEIAGILRKNPNTVYTHLFRAKELLREMLGGMENGR
jgi:RNA polymerase sigma-70 factor (ECF subfamily)